MDDYERYDPDGDIGRLLDFSEPAPLFDPPSPLHDEDSDVLRHVYSPAKEPLPFNSSPPPVPHEDVKAEGEPSGDQVRDDGSLELDILRSMISVRVEVTKQNDGSGASSSNPPAEPVFQRFVPGMLDCTNCRQLAQVIYSNGHDENVSLVIHGGIENHPHNSHFIFYLQKMRPRLEPIYSQFILDVSGKNDEWVSSFLHQYHTQMAKDGCAVVADTASSIINNLYGGYKGHEPRSSVAGGPSQTADSSGSSSISKDSTIGSDYDSEPDEDEATSAATQAMASTSSAARSPQQSMDGNPPRKKARNMSVQRARVANLTLDNLRDYFHLPIETVSRMLCICTSAIKQVCRRNNLERWPHRQIAGYDNKITKLTRRLSTCKNAERYAKIQAEIEELRQKRTCAREGTGSQKKEGN